MAPAGLGEEALPAGELGGRMWGLSRISSSWPRPGPEAAPHGQQTWAAPRKVGGWVCVWGGVCPCLLQTLATSVSSSRPRQLPVAEPDPGGLFLGVSPSQGYRPCVVLRS